MIEVHRLLRQAALRLAIGRFARWFLLTLTAAVLTLGLLVVVERLFAVSVAWPLSLILGGTGALVVGAAIAMLQWPSRLEVAREMDERASLRETLSTAICVQDSADPWSEAAVSQARNAAKQVSVRRALPVKAPRAWPAPLVSAFAVGVLWLALPQWDLMGYLAQAEEKQQQDDEIQQAITQVENADRAITDAMEAMGEQPTSGDQTNEPDFSAPDDPEAIRQMAIKKLTSISDRLNRAREGAEGKMLDAMRDSMSRLKRPGEGALDEVAKALQQGDFKAANEELSKLLEQAAQGGLTDAQTEQLAEQLENLSKQVDELAKRQDTLKQSLTNMGLDPSLASDPDALKSAIENAPGLTQAQKDALGQAMQGMQQSQEMMQQMAQAMNDAGQQMQGQEGQQGQSGQMDQQGMEDLAGQLSQMEMLQAEMDQIDAASQSVWGQLGEMSGQGQKGQGGAGAPEDMLSLWDRKPPPQSGQSNTRGEGGGQFDSEEAAFNATKEKSVGADLGGPVTGTRLVEGEQVIGESRAQFTESVRAGSQSAADAIESQRIPREFHDAVKHYFGRLDAKARGEQYTPPTESADEPAADESTEESEPSGDSH